MTQTDTFYRQRPGGSNVRAPMRRGASRAMFGPSMPSAPQTPQAMFGLPESGPVVVPAGTHPSILSSVVSAMRQRAVPGLTPQTPLRAAGAMQRPVQRSRASCKT